MSLYAFKATDIPPRGVEDFRAALKNHETKLAAAMKQRKITLIDLRMNGTLSDAGDQQARMKLPALRKQDDAQARLIASLEVQIDEARKRLDMAEGQADVVRAKAAVPVAGGERLFEVLTHDGRVVRHRAASLEALRGALLSGYTVRAEVFGASANGVGGVAASIGSDAPSLMKGLLEAFGGELLAFLEAHGFQRNG
jgi:hypothetical protein